MANGGDMVKIMKKQARSFMADVKEDMVVSVDLSKSPFVLTTNDSSVITTHSIVIATGADSRWLGVPGEFEYRGGGVSSCATCDGFLFKTKPCVVIGGGDSAMEDALVLARTCSSVTVLHRGATFRASQVLQKRVLAHSKITVMWNVSVAEFIGKTTEDAGTFLTGVQITNTVSGESSSLECDAAFVAIGHEPNTKLFASQLDMNDVGYINTVGQSTYTSAPGVFAAGDVADHVYRQAITSAGTGAMAALDAERWLSETGKGSEVEAEDFSKWSVKELKSELKDRGLGCSGCFEKSDFIGKLSEAMSM
jgi:thioredoxin reductase